MNSSISAISSFGNGPRIPTTTEMFVASSSNNDDCTDTRRVGDCNLTNVGLIISVNSLIPAMTIHHQLGGVDNIGVSADSICWSKSIRFIKSHLHTLHIQSQLVINYGHYDLISANKVICYCICLIQLYM